MKLPFTMDGHCNPNACIQGDCYRFTLLTERLLRLEYDPEGNFEDRPSQAVINRNFPVPEYHIREENGRLELDTKHFHLIYYYGKEKRFNENSLIIEAKNNFTNYGGRWHFGATHYGDPPRHHNLLGTARTLDRANGSIPLEHGLMDSSGRSFFDGSHTALFGADGSLQTRRPGTVDVYYVCCQRDYTETLQDFYQLTSRPPMLPRYALGNWWSRYHAYSAEEYTALMDRFEAENIPLSMAVLDMERHITDADPKYGKGWTGYTWNKNLFPDPEGFLQSLHKRGLHTCLNLHPADGVQGCEEAYPQMAAATGADPTKDEPVPFDMTDPKFTQANFDFLMHPLEEQGVDHWWIDWQQGRKCAIPNMDPLWLLNHHHYVDNCRNGKRGLILSRYAGLGAHRYPAGFSGDTISTWESLDFQAYFTSSASNVGFSFWSHDIGGFTGGVRDAELFIRWVQLGVFSPFLRLHSTTNPFSSKEPWNFGDAAKPILADWLRLRHKLLPYIYTEVYRQHNQLIPLIRPAYYAYPHAPRAYSEKNQFFFGDSLMVCPITSPADDITGTAGVRAWIPAGVWTDLQTGKTYTGDRVTVLNRGKEGYPVLAKAGAFIPTALYPDHCNTTENPRELEILVFPGANGSYTLYEDNGLSLNATEDRACFTTFTYDEENKQFTICCRGNRELVPAQRKYRITFRGFTPFTPEGACIESVSYDALTRSVTVVLDSVDTSSQVRITLPGARKENNETRSQQAFRFLSLAKLATTQKKNIYSLIEMPIGS